jgi:hypothetical protein
MSVARLYSGNVQDMSRLCPGYVLLLCFNLGLRALISVPISFISHHKEQDIGSEENSRLLNAPVHPAG